MAKTQKGLQAAILVAAAAWIAIAAYEEWKPDELELTQPQKRAVMLYDAGRVGALLRSPAPDWTEGDVAYVKALMEADLPIAKWDWRTLELYGKLLEFDSRWVTREQQQEIAERIADGLPEAFTVHMIGVEGFDGGLVVTLRPEVQDIYWRIDCDVKREMLDELVGKWRAALHAAQDAKGTDRTPVDVTVRTEHGPLAMWDSYTGADIFPLARCGQ